MKRYMKRYILGIIMIIVFFCLPMPVCAEEQTNMRDISLNNYMEKEISYRILGEKILLASADTVTVEKIFEYSGNVTLSKTLKWTEKVNNNIYSGILYLKGVRYFNGMTYATYQGVLYKQ